MIPIINFNDPNIIYKMHKAYTSCGFAVFTHAYDQWISEFYDWKQLMEEYFQMGKIAKGMNAYSGVEDNIGYHGMGTERTNPDSLGDLKETYNWVEPSRMTDQYWP